jgi:hypothetical protein
MAVLLSIFDVVVVIGHIILYEAALTSDHLQGLACYVCS